MPKTDFLALKIAIFQKNYYTNKFALPQGTYIPNFRKRRKNGKISVFLTFCIIYAKGIFAMKICNFLKNYYFNNFALPQGTYISNFRNIGGCLIFDILADFMPNLHIWQFFGKFLAKKLAPLNSP